MDKIKEFNVSKTKNDCFSTVEEALLVAKKYRENHKDLIKINILDGFYKEKLLVKIDNLIIEGSNNLNCIISNDFRANEIMEDNSKRGTFRTSTLHLDSDNIKLINLTIENTAGNGRDNGQCVALYADGDRIEVIDCILKGNQDTLFTAPLPQADKNGSNAGLGPQAIYPRKHCRQLYKNCTIYGNVDFIFGGATAYFDHCNIFVLDDKKNREVKGYIAAPCTLIDLKYGYLFDNCKITGDIDDKSVYLARPWRIGAKCVFINCEIEPNLIKDEVFNDWDKEVSHSTSYFAIDNNELSSTMVNWAHLLNEGEKAKYVEEYFKYFNLLKAKEWSPDIENI